MQDRHLKFHESRTTSQLVAVWRNDRDARMPPPQASPSAVKMFCSCSRPWWLIRGDLGSPGVAYPFWILCSA